MRVGVSIFGDFPTFFGDFPTLGQFSFGDFHTFVFKCLGGFLFCQENYSNGRQIVAFHPTIMGRAVSRSKKIF